MNHIAAWIYMILGISAYFLMKDETSKLITVHSCWILAAIWMTNS